MKDKKAKFTYSEISLYMVLLIMTLTALYLGYDIGLQITIILWSTLVSSFMYFRVEEKGIFQKIIMVLFTVIALALFGDLLRILFNLK